MRGFNIAEWTPMPTLGCRELTSTWSIRIFLFETQYHPDARQVTHCHRHTLVQTCRPCLNLFANLSTTHALPAVMLIVLVVRKTLGRFLPEPPQEVYSWTAPVSFLANSDALVQPGYSHAAHGATLRRSRLVDGVWVTEDITREVDAANAAAQRQ